MAKKRIVIDLDLWTASKEYVESQLVTMRKFGSAPDLTPERYDKLVYDCAAYPQQLRNLQAKIDRKRAKEAR